MIDGYLGHVRRRSRRESEEHRAVLVFGEGHDLLLAVHGLASAYDTSSDVDRHLRIERVIIVTTGLGSTQTFPVRLRKVATRGFTFVYRTPQQIAHVLVQK